MSWFQSMWAVIAAVVAIFEVYGRMHPDGTNLRLLDPKHKEPEPTVPSVGEELKEAIRTAIANGPIRE